MVYSEKRRNLVTAKWLGRYSFLLGHIEMKQRKREQNAKRRGVKVCRNNKGKGVGLGLPRCEVRNYGRVLVGIKVYRVLPIH